MNFAEKISKRLKIARIASGYTTAKEFTNKFSIPSSTYSQHENGKRLLSIEHIMFYSDLIDLDPIWLITGQGGPCGKNRNLDLEEKIFLEQERLFNTGELDAESLPFITFEHKYSNVNVVLLKKILQELLPLLKGVPNSKIEDSINFCFDLYNRILATNAEGKERIKLIRICLESFFNGLGIRVTDEILRNIAIAV